jgi:anaerobic magnesium-protoporphyrin IX monomethyl ester cyclase
MVKVTFVTKGGEYFPPFGIMQISAMAKEAGHSTSFCLLPNEQRMNDSLLEIEKEKPDVVAYSGSTGEHKLYFRFNNELKKRMPELITIMGGPHATFFPEKTLIGASLDAVCIGEGDYAFPRFLNKADEKNGFSDLENIMTTPDKIPKLIPLVQELDLLPFADRNLFYDKGQSGDNPIKHFFATRGCPFRCTYCFNDPFRNMYPGQKYTRRRGIDNIIEEISKVREKWPLRYIKFYDDVFTLRADDWLEEFAEKYSKKVGLPFFCLTRAECVTEDMANLLKNAGCKAVSLSIESANPRIRAEVLNRKMTNEDMKRGYKLFGERGIAIQSNNILGLPTSTIKDDIDTLDFNIECGPKQKTKVIAEFGTAHPYPGTALGEYCQKNGLYRTDAEFKDMHMSYHDQSPLNCFSEMEKRMQYNLTLLGTVAVKFPSLRNLIVNHLIKMPPNPLYFFAFYLAKTTDYMRNVYPIGYTIKDYLRVIPQSIKLDMFKRMRGDEWKSSE